MPAPAPALNYLSSPVPGVEVFLPDLQLKNLYTANTTPATGTGWVFNSGTGGTSAQSYLATDGPGSYGNNASSGFGRLTWSVIPTAGLVGPYRNQTSGPALGTPGATYTHSIWVRTSIDCQIVPRVEFYNGTTLIRSEVGDAVNITANTWTRVVMTRTMPAGADRSRFVAYSPVAGTWSAASVGATFDFSSVLCEQTSDVHDYYFGVSGYQRTNLVGNPSFETDVTGWTNGTGVTSARSTAQAFVGAASNLLTLGGTAFQGITHTSRVAVTANLDYTFSAYVRDVNSGVSWRVSVLWYTASTGGTLLATNTGTVTPISSSAWTRLSINLNAPAGATHASLVITPTAAHTVGSQAYVDAVLFEQKAGLSSYYAGSVGTNAAPDTITIYRLVDGETSTVRNAKAVASSSAFVINDFEAPLGKPVVYWAETFASSASLGAGEKATTTLNVNEVWVHDPLDLTNAMAIYLDGNNDATLGQGSFGEISRTYDYNRTAVLGRQRPVLQYYGEKAIEALSFDVLTKPNGRSALFDLVGVAPVLVRVPGALSNLPRLMYAVLEVTEQPLDWQLTSQTEPLTRNAITLNEVEPQSLDIVITFYSYAYWQSRYASYDAANAVYGSGSYINAVRNPPL